MTVARKSFGEMPNGKKVSLFVLTNANKMQVSLLDYGATVKEILVPNRDGEMGNVSLGFSTSMNIVKKAHILAQLRAVMQIGLRRESFL